MISFGDGKVTLEEAIQVSGSLTDDLMIDFVKDLQETKAEEAFEKLQQLFKMGKEASRLGRRMVGICQRPPHRETKWRGNRS